MFATLEEKIIVSAIVALGILVGILGWNHHERTEGATVCLSQDHTAEIAQSKKDAADAHATVKDLRAQLSRIPATIPSVAPVIRMCVARGSVSSRPTTTTAKPEQLPDSGSGERVLPGTVAGVDIGEGVHDITLSCLQSIADAQELWNLNVKESQP